MAVSKALQRLLRIRDMEVEQRKLALDSALQELRGFEGARDLAIVREREGRQLIGTSARSGDVADRQAGLVETAAARRRVHLLAPRVAASEAESVRLRQDFLEKRRERRQAKTLIEGIMAQEAIESIRRGQQALDDWYGSRRHREPVPSRSDKK
jgi:hypothetical protein